MSREKRRSANNSRAKNPKQNARMSGGVEGRSSLMRKLRSRVEAGRKFTREEMNER